MEKFQDVYGILALAAILPTKTAPKSIMGLWLSNLKFKKHFDALIQDDACYCALNAGLAFDSLDVIHENFDINRIM